MKTCLLCGSSNLTPVVRVDQWTVVECAACELGMLSPWPDDAELARLYQESYFAEHGIGYAESAEDRERGVRGQSGRAALVRSWVSGDKLLDMGSATGHFLAAARARGFDVEGVELSAWAAEQARSELGVPVTLGEISDLGATPRFDVVTMWHSLEHTRDPLSVLRATHALLRDGGTVVIELPNYRSYDAKGYGTAWTGWDLPYHRWHFSPKSLRTLLTQTGFRVRTVQRTPSRYVAARMKRIPIVGWARKLIAAWYVGRDLRIVAIKEAGEGCGPSRPGLVDSIGD
ncbi:MAG: class I SAM-dependent methyltransferase [Nitrospirota bacterium]